MVVVERLDALCQVVVLGRITDGKQEQVRVCVQRELVPAPEAQAQVLSGTASASKLLRQWPCSVAATRQVD